MAKTNSLDAELHTFLLKCCRESMEHIDDACGYVLEDKTLLSMRFAHDRLVSLETALTCVPTHNRKKS